MSPDGRTLATGDMAGAVRFYDAVRHRQLGRAYATCRLCSIVEVQFSPDGTLAVAGTNGAAAGTNGTPLPEGNGLLHLLDVRRRTRIAALDTRAGITELPLYPSETLAFTADSRTLTAASPEQDGAQYHALGCPQRAGARSPTLPFSKPGELFIGVLRRSGSLVTSSSRDLTTVIRDPRTGRAVRRFAFGGRPETLTADGSQMAFQARKGSVRFADLETGSLRTVTGGRKEITSLQFTPDRYRLLIGDADGRIALWDLRRDAPVEEFEGHGGGVNDVAVTRSGATAYSASADGNLIAWISPARDDSPGTFVFCNPQTSCPSEPSRSTLTVPSSRCRRTEASSMSTRALR